MSALTEWDAPSTATAHPVAPWLDRRWLGGAAIVVAGCVLLEARPVLAQWARGGDGAVLVLIGLFVALLVLGATWPVPTDASDRTWSPLSARTLAVIAAGLGAFALGRLVGGGRPPVPASAFVVATNTLAAVSEEALFRRLCFGLLRPAGEGWAIVGSAALFAAVHVTTYGLWVLPLDLAAGLVLGWQRATTGSWFAPAVTHVVVNLLVVL
jgi:membrane protease YdiL (CAAX protease family)